MQKCIAHITDAHLSDPIAKSLGIDPDKNFEAVLKHCTDIGVDELVFAGDIGYDNSHIRFFNLVEKYKPGFKIVLGNHDSIADIKDYYTGKYHVEGLYYSKEDDYYKYIYLDSSSESIGPQQLDWLKSEINTTKKIVVFIHHPVLGVETAMDNLYPLKNRDDVKAILAESRQAVTLFCGHYHMPDKRTAGKITQYITPALSFQAVKYSSKLDLIAPYFGYRLITVTDKEIRTQLVTNYYDKFITGTAH